MNFTSMDLNTFSSGPFSLGWVSDTGFRRFLSMSWCALGFRGTNSFSKTSRNFSIFLFSQNTKGKNNHIFAVPTCPSGRWNPMKVLSFHLSTLGGDQLKSWVLPEVGWVWCFTFSVVNNPPFGMEPTAFPTNTPYII